MELRVRKQTLASCYTSRSHVIRDGDSDEVLFLRYTALARERSSWEENEFRKMITGKD